MKRSIRLEAFYDSPIEEVWAAFTDREELAQWLMPNDFAPVVGHRFQFRSKPMPGWDGTIDCEVLVLEPPTRLSYTWTNAKNKLDTVVTWTLAPVNGGTQVVLEHTGFAGLKGLLLSEMMRRGWKSNMLVKRLPLVLAARRARRVEAS
ncbi:MAG TPA: SRPBCC domain-containing protein [Nannocystaceae bacterium]|nr:SRPBCC domain-containing protein [Nannocystaceae bacterium]